MPGLCNTRVNFFRNQCETFLEVRCGLERIPEELMKDYTSPDDWTKGVRLESFGIGFRG